MARLRGAHSASIVCSTDDPKLWQLEFARMTSALLSTFMREDCTPHERALVLEAVARWEVAQAPVIQHPVFNRFEFTFDANAGKIVIADVLDATENGLEQLSSVELKAALQQWRDR